MSQSVGYFVFQTTTNNHSFSRMLVQPFRCSGVMCNKRAIFIKTTRKGVEGWSESSHVVSRQTATLRQRQEAELEEAELKMFGFS